MQRTSLIVLLTVIACCVSRYLMTQLIEELKFVLPNQFAVSAASPICSDFQTFCPDWLHFGHFLCFGGIAASQLSLRIFPIYF